MINLAVLADGVLQEIPIKLLRTSQYALRTNLGDLDELKNSIRENGLLQPVIARPSGKGFEIVAGHRRAESCRQLRWSRITCCIVSLSDKEAYESSLAENLQRKTLQPMEEALAFKRYVDDFGWGGVSELAKKIGKSPSYVSHTIRLLELPREVKAMVESSELTSAAASELLWANDRNLQRELAQVAVKENLTTAEIRQAIKGQNKSETDEGWAGWNHQGDADKQRKGEVKFRKKTLVTLHIAMVQLDEILKEMDNTHYEGTLKECLTNKRWTIHRMIDDFIKDDLKLNKYVGKI